MRGFLAFLFLGLVALGAGAIGYSIGLSQHVATAAANGAPVYAGGWHWGGMFFFPFGFFLVPLFFIAFFGFLAFAFGPRRRRWGRYGGYGPMGFGPYGPGAGDDPRGTWIADAHRRLHEEEARGSAAAGATAGSNANPPSGSTGAGPSAPSGGPSAG